MKPEDRARGQRIETVRMDGGTLTIVFETGAQLRFCDTQRSCCEKRHMSCDDDLTSFTGDTFLKWEVSDVTEPSEENYSCHDVQFLRIHTTGGVIVAQNHNVHNGYYAGFNVVAEFKDGKC